MASRDWRPRIPCTATLPDQPRQRPAPPRRRKWRSPPTLAAFVRRRTSKPHRSRETAESTRYGQESTFRKLSAVSFQLNNLCPPEGKFATVANRSPKDPFFTTTPTLISAQRWLVALPLQKIRFVHIHRLLISEEGDDNAQSDRGLCGCIGNNENCKHLPVQSVQPRKCHQVQVHGVQDQLNRHQDDDHVSPRQHSNGADNQQRCCGYQIMQNCNFTHTSHSVFRSRFSDPLLRH